MARAADGEGLNGAPARHVAPRARSPVDLSATSASPRPSPHPLTTFAVYAALAQPAAPPIPSFRHDEEVDDEPEPVMPSAAAQPTPAADEKAPGDYDDVIEMPYQPPPLRLRRRLIAADATVAAVGEPSLIHTCPERAACR